MVYFMENEIYTTVLIWQKEKKTGGWFFSRKFIVISITSFDHITSDPSNSSFHIVINMYE